jgi:hypothetical protein
MPDNRLDNPTQTKCQAGLIALSDQDVGLSNGRGPPYKGT